MAVRLRDKMTGSTVVVDEELADRLGENYEPVDQPKRRNTRAEQIEQV